MKTLNFLSRHVSDLLVYCLVPLFSLFVPASLSRWLISRISAWQWLLRADAVECWSRAAEYTSITNTREWMCRWRIVTILEVRDLTLLMWGRRNSVFKEISGSDELKQTENLVLVGMHWGPSIAILSLLQSKGLKPLLVYRPVEFSIFKVRPWFYFFLKRSVRYIHRTCGDQRAITIKGAGAALKRELPQPGTSVVVLDAPPAPDRSTIDGMVLGRPVKFNAGFPGILKESGREYQFYAITLNQGPDTLRKLELLPAQRPESQQQLIGDYCNFLTEHIGADSAQWRIWQVADQFFQPVSSSEGESTTSG